MRISDNGINIIKEFEGFRSKPYKDIVGIPTIGYGTTSINGKPVTMSTPAVTESYATELLVDHVRGTELIIEKYVTVPLTQNQFDALVSFAYNVGNGALRSSTLLKKLNSGDYIGASREFDRWTRAGGKVSSGLVRRRKLEKELFLKGI